MSKTKRTKNGVFIDRLIRFLGSDMFFRGVIVVFALQAVWLAVSASFPMLYDEYFHVSFIDIFSDQLSPVISSQSSGDVSRYSDLTRNPQLIYHYIMSFPYRITGLMTESFYIKVVLLRLINVASVVFGLVLFRKILNKISNRKAVVNVSLLVLTLMPMLVFVSAHVNYDNLFFLLAPALILHTLAIVESKKIEIYNVLLFLIISFFGVQVKMGFAVLAVPSLIYILLVISKRHIKIKNIPSNVRLGSKAKVVMAGFLLLIVVGLFTERYVVNVVEYGSLAPSCSSVHGEESCKDYRFVRRGRQARERFLTSGETPENPLYFTKDIWLPFIVEGATIVGVEHPFEDLDRIVVFPNKIRTGAHPPSVLTTFMWVFLFSSILLVAYSFDSIKKTKHFGYFFVLIFSLVMMLLFYVNYSGYTYYGQAFAVQLRYLLPVLPLAIFYSVLSADRAMRGRRYVKLATLAVVVLIFTQGGGILTYIVSSNSTWYWQREDIIDINQKFKEITEPIIINSEGMFEGFTK